MLNPRAPRGSNITDEMTDGDSKGTISDEAFEKAVKDYRERIFLVMLKYVRNREDAKDLTQDTFVRAYKARHSFRGESGLYTWIFRIAVNLAINHKTRSRDSSLSSLEYSADMADNSDPARDITNRELDRDINKAVDSLPARQRMAFVLRYYEGMPFAEVAETMGVTEGAAKANYHQAVRKLQKGLQPHWQGTS
jgi:RNA polymerase sigma factor (sigma-70 family)